MGQLHQGGQNMQSSQSTLTACQVTRSLLARPHQSNLIVENSRPNYRVLATDYLNYAIVYDCFDIFGLFKAESLWLLTRAETPEQGLVDQAYK